MDGWPPGFTIACEACIAYLRDGTYPASLREEVAREIEASRAAFPPPGQG